MTDTKSLLTRNMMTEAQEVCREIGRPFVDADVEKYDLGAAAAHFVKHYAGNNKFIANIRRYADRLTVAQQRGALNVMRADLLKSEGTGDQEVDGTTTVKVPERPGRSDEAVPGNYPCYVKGCGKRFHSMDDVLRHKNAEHGGTYKVGAGSSQTKEPAAPAPVAVEPGLVEAPVIAVTASTMNLDISALAPEPGVRFRYAIPRMGVAGQLNKNNSTWLFVSVQQTIKDKARDRRYNYGVIRHGYEANIPAGTIEVREWSSDQKRLCGEQFPGDVYRGEFEKHLGIALSNPEAFAKLFGQASQRCFRCGKHLDDDVSVALGYGPECEKHIHHFEEAMKRHEAAKAARSA